MSPPPDSLETEARVARHSSRLQLTYLLPAILRKAASAGAAASLSLPLLLLLLLPSKLGKPTTCACDTISQHARARSRLRVSKQPAIDHTAPYGGLIKGASSGGGGCSIHSLGSRAECSAACFRLQLELGRRKLAAADWLRHDAAVSARGEAARNEKRRPPTSSRISPIGGLFPAN